ncbi:MAG: 3-methyl-2-oxobutanoate hydroxymethyltransferase [Dehalococcoidales bacterium]|nr:3-methyl-2-oxobutanoate hydroxymethyltransferase [Dehalococcoidales bacterium]
MGKRKTIQDFRQMKQSGEKVTWITSYDYHMARMANEVGINMILVGDSVGMTVYGYPGTLPVTMDQIIPHTEAVRRGAPDVFVVGDLPFGAYHANVEDAVMNSVRFYKECDVDAVKLEGGKRVTPQIRAIADGGMLVIGHIGITPQSSAVMGGFKAQGNTAEAAKILLDDAVAIEEAGAAMLLVEGVPAETGKIITEALSIPVMGIGAGINTDGQLMIVSDMLGLFETFTPKFVKKYANLANEIRIALQQYINEVHEGKFPTSEYCYKMKTGEADKLKAMMMKS